ncbi:uncharacterized protein DUF1624 [Rhodovulum steppense]|uniref:Uncharacterized protein DUF1624 n=2 Tax=Rhodovulum steppense TaxID=540251 RepID=A0A4R1YNB9_9RHOB|nr:uncharacterized protein DUF1624 [Rhodovulum steppense]
MALVGMGVFHLVYDLEMFGHLPPGTAVTGGWRILSFAVAGSFLFLAGVSLQLAHGHGLRPRAFLRRLAMIAGAAGLVSLGTWVMFPTSFVYFGILHSIAAASILGLAFLRQPAVLTLAAAGAVLMVAQTGLGLAPSFRGIWLDWTGLTASPRPSVDFVPIIPWLAPFLSGIALASLATQAGLHKRFERHAAATPLMRRLTWPGRHSLAIYLLHQPVLIGLVWAGTWLGR